MGASSPCAGHGISLRAAASASLFPFPAASNPQSTTKGLPLVFDQQTINILEGFPFTVRKALKETVLPNRTCVFTLLIFYFSLALQRAKPAFPHRRPLKPNPPPLTSE